MTETPLELIEWARAYLQGDEDIIVPIKKMWNEWHGARGTPSFEEFTRIVLSDDRIEEIPGVDHREQMAALNPVERLAHEVEMEEHGYFSGPRAKLKSRQVTLEHITRMLKKHNDQMEKTLHQAQAILPANMGEAVEGRLIGVITLVKKLRRELRAAGLEPPEDIWSKRPTG